MPLLLLSACSKEASKKIAPDVVNYPQHIMTKAANEMQSGQCQILSNEMMPDYQVMRDQARALVD